VSVDFWWMGGVLMMLEYGGWSMEYRGM